MIWAVGFLRPGQDLFLQRNRLAKFPLLIERLHLLPPRPHLRWHHFSATPRLYHQPRLAGRHPSSLDQRQWPDKHPCKHQQSRTQFASLMALANEKQD